MTVRVEGPEAVTPVTIVVVMVCVRTDAWPVLAMMVLAVLDELGADAGTSRVSATNTRVTLRACCEALVVGAVLVEVLEGPIEPLVVELPLSLRTLAPAHEARSSESLPVELAIADIGPMCPVEGS